MSPENNTLDVATEAELAAEMTRRAALQAMGIGPLVSIVDGPAAKACERRLIPLKPEQSHEQGSPAGQQSKDPSMSPMPEARLSAAQATPAGAATAGTIPKSGGEASRSSTKAEAAEFSIVIIAAGSLLWLEELSDGLVRQDQLALVAAMARAVSGSQSAVDHQQFDWPPSGASAMASDRESATQALHGLIQRLARDSHAKRVIMMGPCDYLPTRIAEAGVRIPSSLAMLENPTLKATAWEALKPLRSIME